MSRYRHSSATREGALLYERPARGGNVADDVAIAGTRDAMGLIGPRALWTEAEDRFFRAERSGAADKLHRELGQLLPIQVGDQPVTQLSAPPEDHVEPAGDRCIRPGVAQRLAAAGGPGPPIGAEDEQRDRVEPAVEHEDRRLAVEEVADGAPLKRELLVSEEGDHGGEVQSALEPGLDLMHAAALDVERVLARENPQVVVHCLGDHTRPIAQGDGRLLIILLIIVERYGEQERRRDGEGRNEGASPSAPPRRAGDGCDRPVRRQAPLQGQRGRVLRQLLFEHLGERLLSRLFMSAGRAAVEVSADRLLRVRPEPPALVIEEMRSHVLAVHATIYLA